MKTAVVSGLTKIAAEAGADLDAHLNEATTESCSLCGQPHLRRFEVLNRRRCERCRLKYLAKQQGNLSR